MLSNKADPSERLSTDLSSLLKQLNISNYMFDYRRSTDLFPLELLADILVRTAWQMNLEDAAAEEKAFIFQSYRGPISYSLNPSTQKTRLWWWVSHLFETGEKCKIHCFGKDGPLLSLPSLTSNVEFHVLEFCAQL